jgi:dephospho-CoA kinase
MKQIMLAHLRKFPLMQAADMVKLLYQSEFAGGHLIADTAESLDRIEAECTVSRSLAIEDAFEDIGGGLCRLYLGAMPALGLRPETVNRLFVATANVANGSMLRLDGKLKMLLECCQNGTLPFDAKHTEAYLREYRALGCPPVSHSAQYRSAYAPAYRVIRAAYRHYIEVFRCIDALLDIKRTVCVAIDGNSGAGKSTLAALVAGVYDCNVFHTDHFFLPEARKTAARLAEAGGNVDSERFHGEVSAGIKSRAPFDYRVYDCQSGMLSEPVRVTPKKLSIVEGVYSLHPALDMSCDLTIFLKTGGTAQRERILQRNGKAMLARFENEWIPLENKYFEMMRIPQRCDIVYDAQFMLDEY